MANIDLIALFQEAISSIKRNNELLEQLISMHKAEQPEAPKAEAAAKPAEAATKANPAPAPETKQPEAEAPNPAAEPADDDEDAILSELCQHQTAFLRINGINRAKAAVIVRKYSPNTKLAQCGSLSAIRSCVAELKAIFPEAWA